MVGPRHLLTVSHMVQWLPNNQAGWIRFRPSFFDGSAPFGDAWAQWTYYKYKVSGPTIDVIEGMFDYVCVVLNWPIGNATGWIGSRGYTDAWDGGTYWSHIGYPGDLTGGNRPTFQNGIALDGAWWEFDSNEAMAHHADVWPGQSGGPFFGWWSNEAVAARRRRAELTKLDREQRQRRPRHGRPDHPSEERPPLRAAPRIEITVVGGSATPYMAEPPTRPVGQRAAYGTDACIRSFPCLRPKPRKQRAPVGRFPPPAKGRPARDALDWGWVTPRLCA